MLYAILTGDNWLFDEPLWINAANPSDLFVRGPKQWQQLRLAEQRILRGVSIIYPLIKWNLAGAADQGNAINIHRRVNNATKGHVNFSPSSISQEREKKLAKVNQTLNVLTSEYIMKYSLPS